MKFDESDVLKKFKIKHFYTVYKICIKSLTKSMKVDELDVLKKFKIKNFYAEQIKQPFGGKYLLLISCVRLRIKRPVTRLSSVARV